MEELTKRVERLERQSRWLKLLVVAVLAVVAAMGCAGGSSTSKTVEAERFIVRDSKGRKRVELSSGKVSSDIKLYDLLGKEHIVLSAWKDMASLSLKDRKGQTGVFLLQSGGNYAGLMVEAPEGGGQVFMCSAWVPGQADGVARLSLSRSTETWETPSASLEVERNGLCRLKLNDMLWAYPHRPSRAESDAEEQRLRKEIGERFGIPNAETMPLSELSGKLRNLSRREGE